MGSLKRFTLSEYLDQINIKIKIMSRNTDPFAPWNNPMYENDPLAAHNNPMYKDDPFKPWNEPFGSVNDLNREEKSSYGIRRNYRDNLEEEDYDY
jgi:hypothetical protein